MKEQETKDVGSHTHLGWKMSVIEGAMSTCIALCLVTSWLDLGWKMREHHDVMMILIVGHATVYCT